MVRDKFNDIDATTLLSSESISGYTYQGNLLVEFFKELTTLVSDSSLRVLRDSR